MGDAICISHLVLSFHKPNRLRYKKENFDNYATILEFFGKTQVMIWQMPVIYQKDQSICPYQNKISGKLSVLENGTLIVEILDQFFNLVMGAWHQIPQNIGVIHLTRNSYMILGKTKRRVLLMPIIKS